MKANYLLVLSCAVLPMFVGCTRLPQPKPPFATFHYALVGSANGLDVEVNLDNFVLPWLLEYRDMFDSAVHQDQEKAKTIASEIKVRLDATTVIYHYKARVMNGNDNVVPLDMHTDILTLHERQEQKDFRPDPGQKYPSELLAHSFAEISFLRDASPVDRSEAISNADFWTGQNDQLSKLAPLVQKDRKNVEYALATISKSLDKSFFGYLSLGSAGLRVPLAVEITLADERGQAR